MKRLNKEGRKIISMKREYVKNIDNEIIVEAILETVKNKVSSSTLTVFMEKDEECLIKVLARLKKFQADETDKFDSLVEEAISVLDGYNLNYTLISDKENFTVTIRRFFGLDSRDFIKYFGVTKNEKIFNRYVSRNKEFIESFMTNKVKLTLESIAEVSLLEYKRFKDLFAIKVSDPYRHEEYETLYNINYDIVIDCKKLDLINFLPKVRLILKSAITNYEVSYRR